MSDENEFQPEELPQHTAELVPMGALESIERAQIDMQISTAKRYPRSMAKVKNDMLSLATLDEETASACFYTLPRGGKTIQGPSVRLAEIALSSYGNVRASTRVISEVTDGPLPHVMIQSVCFDLEKNIAVSIEKRRRITKKKSKAAIDEDDINLAVNACSAIAFRDAVFKVVPGALVKPVFDAARKCAVGDVKSLAVKRGKVIDRIKQMGVTEDRIFAAVGCTKIDEVDLDKLEILIGLGTGIKDGNTTLEEAFPHAAHPGMTPQKAEPIQQAPAQTTAPAKEEAKQPLAQAEAPKPAAEPAKAPVQEKHLPQFDAQHAATPAPVVKPAPVAQPAAPSTVPQFDAAVHIPMLREKLKKLGIGIMQFMKYMADAYHVDLCQTLDEAAQKYPTRLVRMLFGNLDKPKVVADIKALPGASTVE